MYIAVWTMYYQILYVAVWIMYYQMWYVAVWTMYQITVQNVVSSRDGGNGLNLHMFLWSLVRHENEGSIMHCNGPSDGQGNWPMSWDESTIMSLP